MKKYILGLMLSAAVCASDPSRSMEVEFDVSGSPVVARKENNKLYIETGMNDVRLISKPISFLGKDYMNVKYDINITSEETLPMGVLYLGVGNREFTIDGNKGIFWMPVGMNPGSNNRAYGTGLHNNYSQDDPRNNEAFIVIRNSHPGDNVNNIETKNVKFEINSLSYEFNQ